MSIGAPSPRISRFLSVATAPRATELAYFITQTGTSAIERPIESVKTAALNTYKKERYTYFMIINFFFSVRS